MAWRDVAWRGVARLGPALTPSMVGTHWLLDGQLWGAVSLSHQKGEAFPAHAGARRGPDPEVVTLVRQSERGSRCHRQPARRRRSLTCLSSRPEWGGQSCRPVGSWQLCCGDSECGDRHTRPGPGVREPMLGFLMVPRWWCQRQPACVLGVEPGRQAVLSVVRQTLTARRSSMVQTPPGARLSQE